MYLRAARKSLQDKDGRSNMKNGEMLIGWSEVSITPDKRVGLMGQFIERISEYTETEVTATSVAISRGKEAVVFCSCDLVGVTRGLVSAVREKITARGGPDPDKIIINATHTHTSLQYKDGLDTLSFSAGILGRYLPYEKAEKGTEEDIMGEEEAFDFLAERIASGIIKAWESRKPGYIDLAFGRAAVGMCRRVCYSDGHALMWGDTAQEDFVSLEGGNDSGIELMYFHDASGSLTGAAVNIACPAQVLEHRLFISSDYWGKVKKRLRGKYGKDFFVLALCAPAGDQCPRDLIRWVAPEIPIADPNINRGDGVKRRADPSMFDITGAETVGRRVSDEVSGVYESGTYERAGSEFRHTVRKISLPVRRVTKTERDEAERKITEAASHMDKANFDYSDNAILYVYAGTVARYETQDLEPETEIELHTVRIGDAVVSTSPFELFLDFGNRIRARSPAAQTFLIQLAGDSLGYLPTEKAELGGHYSAYVSSGVIGHEGGDILVEEALGEIRRLFEE